MIRLLIPESGPLISLARVDRLDLIDRFDGQIILPDAVAIEVTRRKELQDAKTISDWLSRGGNRVQIVETTFGQLVKQNQELLEMLPPEIQKQQSRKFQIKNVGEHAVREFTDSIRTAISEKDTALVLFEDQRIKKMDFGDHVHLMSTWSFAKALERMDIIPSASGLFDEIEDAGRNPPRDPFEAVPQGRESDIEAHFHPSSPS
jgi:predicted nucleic acid-binding protein